MGISEPKEVSQLLLLLEPDGILVGPNPVAYPQTVIEDCVVYLDGVRGSEPLAIEDAFEASRNSSAFVWLDLYEPTLKEFEAVREEFSLQRVTSEEA